jgi:hypothetical protein
MRLAATRFVALALVLGASAAGVAQAPISPERQLEFLRTARITNPRPIGKGVTGSLRMTLTDGTLTHDAAFQAIEERASSEDRRQGRRRAGELNFVDSYKYNIAAYELARLMGVSDMMPPTIERRWGGRIGSLTWWVDDVLMDEAARDQANTQPPSALAFTRERMRMHVFAELVGDVDRNKGNILYTKDWRVVMIDFTRAFRLHRTLRQPQTLTTIERGFWSRLQQVTRDDIRRAADSFLTLEEIAATAARREILVEHYTRLISERGETVVVY